MRELQKTAILNSAHIPWKTIMENYKAFNMENNITTAAKLFPYKHVFFQVCNCKYPA
jgi:hypothetical protein